MCPIFGDDAQMEWLTTNLISTKNVCLGAWTVGQLYTLLSASYLFSTIILAPPAKRLGPDGAPYFINVCQRMSDNVHVGTNLICTLWWICCSSFFNSPPQNCFKDFVMPVCVWCESIPPDYKDLVVILRSRRKGWRAPFSCERHNCLLLKRDHGLK